MPRRLMMLAALTVLGSSQAVCAQDEVFLRGKEKPLKVTITAESGLGLEQDLGKGKAKEMIPAEDIVDVMYNNLTPDGVRVNIYRPAFTKERKYFDPAARKDPKEKITLGEIIKAYAEAFSQVKEKYAKQHLEYKIAYLSVLLAQEEGAGDDAALQKLAAFKSKHPDSWQIASCLRLLANMQIAQKKLKEAEDTYQELAAANVAPEVKLEGELLAAQVGLRGGKGNEAIKKLDDILAKLPKDSRFYARARIAKAESLATSKDKDQAIAMLRQIIKESSDKAVKATAYNALGEIFFHAAAYKEARWEFLHVDVLYNQDRNEHAKALYYLSQVFDKLGEPERAKECRDILAADRQFAGLEWQRLALQPTKTP
ncbi:MAG: tetratricopeptide repeat protein [Planctomycetes bacterium]|nr:tetratricopeptide repeat protein [Planctomycetota bacterium]